MAAILNARKLKPDFARLERVLRRSGLPDRVPLYELFSEIEGPVLAALGEPAAIEQYGRADDPAAVKALARHIRYQELLGYDYATVREQMTGFVFQNSSRRSAGTREGVRNYMDEAGASISDRKTYEAYRWPEVEQLDLRPFDRAGSMLVDGMKLIADSPGVFENTFWLVGYDGLAYLQYDDPALLEQVFNEVGTRIVEYFKTVVDYDCVGAVRYGEDMGFKTQLLVSPQFLRRYVFPWHSRIVTLVHAAGKPLILHACGNIDEVMGDIISLGWDAKHSFEDVIEPVWIAKERYGARIALLGGFDMDKLATMTEEEVRAHTRFLVERCGGGGGWALGSGNSITDYIPVGNLLAMIDEGLRVGVL